MSIVLDRDVAGQLMTEPRKTPRVRRGRGRARAQSLFLAQTEIVESGCWEWVGDPLTRFPRNYRESQKMPPERLAWLLFKGPLDHQDEVVQACENERCVHPHDLYVVDLKDYED